MYALPPSTTAVASALGRGRGASTLALPAVLKLCAVGLGEALPPPKTSAVPPKMADAASCVGEARLPTKRS
jgi:hypothetical protein